MSSNASSRASSPGGSPDRSRSNKENEPALASAPTTPPNSPAGKKSKKSSRGPMFGGISKRRRSLGLGRSSSSAGVLGGAGHSNTRRVTLAGTSLFAEAAYSDAAAELELENMFFNIRAKELTESPLADLSSAFQPPLPFSPSALHESLMDFES